MVSFDTALSVFVCDARFGRDPCAVFDWTVVHYRLLFGLFANFLPRYHLDARVTPSQVLQ